MIAGRGGGEGHLLGSVGGCEFLALLDVLQELRHGLLENLNFKFVQLAQSQNLVHSIRLCANEKQSLEKIALTNSF